MVSRVLMGVWAALDFLLLTAGAVALALSIVWRRPDLLMNITLTTRDLTAGTILGIMLIVTFMISVAAVVQRNHITIGLVITNYVLLLDALGIIVIGTFLWFFSLKERAEYSRVWDGFDDNLRQQLQDKLSCCGYFNSTDRAVTGGFCDLNNQTFFNDHNSTNFFCVTPITSFVDMTLNNVFTTIYGFMAIILCLLLATLCVIKKRHEDERFKKIDAKRGGKGFV